MKLFIYGGTGYLGSSLICGLGLKHYFYVTTRGNYKSSNKNLIILNQEKDKDKITKYLRKADLIIIANGPSNKDSKKELSNYLRYLNNEIDLILKCKRKKTKIVYFSTIHVYENMNKKKAKTNDFLISKSHYAIRNIMSENLILNKLNFQNVNILRLSNVFGIHKKMTKFNKNLFMLAVNQFCLDAINERKIIVKSNKKELRNYVSINDFVEFIRIGFIEKKYNFKPIINYASDHVISLNDLINTIKKELKKFKSKKPNISFENKIKKTHINYKFDINDISKKKLKPKILLKNEIYNTLKKLI